MQDNVENGIDPFCGYCNGTGGSMSCPYHNPAKLNQPFIFVNDWPSQNIETWILCPKCGEKIKFGGTCTGNA